MALNLNKEILNATKNGRPLSDYDIKFILDCSGSMKEPDCYIGSTNYSRWLYGQKTIHALAIAAQQVDTDGISVGFFNNKFTIFENTVPEKVAEIFRKVSPDGGTDTAGALKAMFSSYLKARDGGWFSKPSNPKPVILIVMTDGTPSDKPATKQVIIDFTKSLKREDEFAVSFIQVGNDRGASDFLNELDTGLKSQGAKFDIVSSFPIEKIKTLSVEEFLLKALTAS